MDLREAERCIARHDCSGLYQVLGKFESNDLTRDELRALTDFAFGQTPIVPRLGGTNGIFAASIAATRNFWCDADLSARDHHHINRRTIGRDHDFIGLRPEVEEWPAAMALNYLLMNRIKPRRRAAVVGTMRDDGIYVLEWIAHHLVLGFEGIFIYTNDNADGSERLLRRLADHRIITLIESETDGTVRPEAKAFDHAIHLLHDLRDYEWVLFVDSDEFFQPGSAHGHDVTRILNAAADHFPDRLPAAILYEWLWYNSGMVFAREPGLLMERFQHARPHWLTKPLVRIRAVSSLRQQHVPDPLPDEFVVNSVFEKVDPDKVWNRRLAAYDGGRINHYWPKSFEEFSVKKARGETIDADGEYRRDFRLFFEWNGAETPETHWPIDPAPVTAVKAAIRRLRDLEGIAECEARVDRGFRDLLDRFQSDGGLETIYRALSEMTFERSLPAS